MREDGRLRVFGHGELLLAEPKPRGGISTPYESRERAEMRSQGDGGEDEECRYRCAVPHDLREAESQGLVDLFEHAASLKKAITGDQ